MGLIKPQAISAAVDAISNASAPNSIVCPQHCPSRQLIPVQRPAATTGDPQRRHPAPAIGRQMLSKALRVIVPPPGDSAELRVAPGRVKVRVQSQPHLNNCVGPSRKQPYIQSVGVNILRQRPTRVQPETVWLRGIMCLWLHGRFISAT